MSASHSGEGPGDSLISSLLGILELPANQLIKVFSLVHGWWLLPVPCSRSRHCSHGTEVFGTLVRSCWSLRSYKQVGNQDPTDRCDCAPCVSFGIAP